MFRCHKASENKNLRENFPPTSQKVWGSGRRWEEEKGGDVFFSDQM